MRAMQPEAATRQHAADRCGRFAAANLPKRGLGIPETFELLGLTHYCREKRNGRFGLRRNLVGQRTRCITLPLRQRLRRMNQGMYLPGRWLRQVLWDWLQ